MSRRRQLVTSLIAVGSAVAFSAAVPALAAAPTSHPCRPDAGEVARADQGPKRGRGLGGLLDPAKRAGLAEVLSAEDTGALAGAALGAVLAGDASGVPGTTSGRVVELVEKAAVNGRNASTSCAIAPKPTSPRAPAQQTWH